MKTVLLEPLVIAPDVLERVSGFLSRNGHAFTAYDTRVEDDDTLIARSQEAEILMVGNLPLSAKVINAVPNLKMISVAFTGLDHIDLDACRERGVTVCNCAGYSTDSVAELAFGFMISLLRFVVQCDHVTRECKTRAGFIGNDLKGKTLGIVGTGAIGTRVAEIGKAFGCDLIAYSRTPKAAVEALGVRYLELDDVLAQSDIVTLHLPLTDATRGIISREKLSLMKPSALLINTSRGPVVDIPALAEALDKKQIAGAALDVFETEPPLPEGYPLFDKANALLAPHVAFATEEAFVRRADIAFANIECWLAGKPQNKIL
jgi:phosphoglycerate dehydrogenase-like enzyme